MSCKSSELQIVPYARMMLAFLFFILLSCNGQLDAGQLESRRLANIRQVTSGFAKAGEGYFSPDGRRIVFQAVPKEYPFYQIYTQSLDPPSKPQRISTGRGRTTCSYFHPDGRTILFASSHLDPQLDATESQERRQLEAEKKSGKRRRYSWVFDPHMDIFELRDENLVPLTRQQRLRCRVCLFARWQANRLLQRSGRRSRSLHYGSRWVPCSPTHQRTRLRWRTFFFAGWSLDRLSHRPQKTRPPPDSCDPCRRRTRSGTHRQHRSQLGPLLAPPRALHHLVWGGPLRSQGPAQLRSLAHGIQRRGRKIHRGQTATDHAITPAPMSCPSFHPMANS